MDFQEFYDFEAYTAEIDSWNNIETPVRERKTKRYRDRFDPMINCSDDEFRLRYRFSKESMKKVIELVRPDLTTDTRGGGIPIELQVMAVIRYWGRHEIQEDCADIHGMSQQTLSRLARKVANALASKSSLYIKMPSNVTEETNAIRKFEAICGLRGIVGAIDCTHVKIRKVSGTVGQYHINRKGHYSINTQVVCDTDLKICDIVCHWRGSTHDARIWRESSIKERFERNEFTGRLIGDSGYPCTPHLITPILRPSNANEERFNHHHIQTRNVIERCFGVLKNRFRVLLEVMRGSYSTIKSTIIACAVLHNLAIEFKEEQDIILQFDEEETEDIVIDDEVAHISRRIYIENQE